MVFLKNDKIVVGPVQANRVFAAKRMKQAQTKVAKVLVRHPSRGTKVY